VAEENSPVFVLCCSRTGSTLLRYILDSHPDFCCPPELHLGRLARSLVLVYSVTLQCDVQDLDDNQESILGKRARKNIEDIMAEYVGPLGKKVWCEKSIFTIDNLPFVELVFPDARYLCLYRNCLDQVASALDTLDRDLSGMAYGFYPYLSRNRRDPWNALTDYWIEKITAILAYEKANPSQCIRLRYEDIVSNAEAQLENLFTLLNSRWSREMTASIFDRARKGGRGDYKIIQTDRILDSSVGRGKYLVKKISEDRQQKINELNAILGYPSLHA